MKMWTMFIYNTQIHTGQANKQTNKQTNIDSQQQLTLAKTFIIN